MHYASKSEASDQVTTEQQNEHDHRIVTHVTKLLQKRFFRDYDYVAEWQKDLQTSVRALIAQRMAPALNQRLTELPQKTLAEKQDLCRWVNEELRSSGLAIRCPKTELPAILHADPGFYPDVGRFQIELIGKSNHRKKTVSSHDPTKIFPIEIMDHPVRIEASSEYWARKAKGKRPFGRGEG
jgi:hypothetical protein